MYFQLLPHFLSYLSSKLPDTLLTDFAGSAPRQTHTSHPIWLVALAFEEPALGRVQVGDSPVVRLTNQPGLPEGERGSWIMSRKDDRGRHMWHHVKWEDEESFVRLQSAATKALDCVHPA